MKKKKIVNISPDEMTYEDWFNLGKADVWAGRPKQAPEVNSQAASLYDLGYNEGAIEPSPLKRQGKISS